MPKESFKAKKVLSPLNNVFAGSAGKTQQQFGY